MNPDELKQLLEEANRRAQAYFDARRAEERELWTCRCPRFCVYHTRFDAPLRVRRAR